MIVSAECDGARGKREGIGDGHSIIGLKTPFQVSSKECPGMFGYIGKDAVAHTYVVRNHPMELG